MNATNLNISPIAEAVSGPQLSLVQTISAEQMIDRIRQRCEEDFEFFVRYFFKHRKGVKFIFNDHHHVICQDLMDVYNGMHQGYILNIPPRYSKTEVVVILFTVWCYVKNPKCEFIHLSYAQPLVLENSDAIRTVIKSAEFTQLWPHIKTKDNKDAKGAWATSANGMFLATPAGGTITGFGAGRMDEWNEDTGEFKFSGAILIDDPLKPDDARHPTMLSGVNKRWDETIKSRRNSPKTPVILVMQRLHEEDFTAELLKDDSVQWFHRVMPAIVDEGMPTERALWPAKHDLETLKKMKAKSAYVFSGQYGQKPSPLGGGLIKGAWFGRYKVLPRQKYRKIYVDTAQKTKERHDYSVLEVWGHGEDGNIYLLDLKRDKWESPDLRKNARDFWNKHRGVSSETHGHLRQMRVEDKASGTDLIQSLKRDKTNPIPIYAQQRNIDKVTRVGDASPYIEAGFVFIPDPELGLPWVSDFVSECESFTSDDTHAYDDQIDPMCDAIMDMLGGRQIANLWENMT
ncbi:Terminase-like family protein [compost metagenome]